MDVGTNGIDDTDKLRERDEHLANLIDNPGNSIPRASHLCAQKSDPNTPEREAQRVPMRKDFGFTLDIMYNLNTIEPSATMNSAASAAAVNYA